jgi:hypothetical protein
MRPKAFAAKDHDVSGSDQLCRPTVEPGGLKPQGWFAAEFINRAVVRITYTPQGQCGFPAGKDSTFIFGDKKFQDLVGGDYTDENATDGDIRYLHITDGNDSIDEGRLKNFDGKLDDGGNSGGTSDPFGGRDKWVDASTIGRYTQGVEWIPAVEEGTLGGPDCVISGIKDDTNLNWALWQTGSGGMDWGCTTDTNELGTGFRVGSLINSASYDNFNLVYRVAIDGDKVTIDHISKNGNKRNFTFCPDTNTFRSNDCRGPFTLSGISPDEAKSFSGTDLKRVKITKDGSNDSFETGLGAADSANGQSTGQPGGANGAGTQDVDDPEIRCASGGGFLSFILCPLVVGISTLVDKITNLIISQMTVDTEIYFQNDGGLHDVWQSIRILSLSMLVIVALVMVISQAMNFGMFEAYTVKKLLPRLISAVILVAFSWEIGKFMVILSNDLGHGVRGLLFSAVPGDHSIVLGLEGNLVTGGVGLTILATMGPFGALSFIGTGLLALLVGFIILIIRQVIVVMAVVFIPLAFMANILPGTRKFWEFWKAAFQGALLAFPLIVGFISLGQLMADIYWDSAPHDLVGAAVTLVLYIGPFFLLPLALRLAGGLVGTLTGMVNDRSRGGFDRLKNFRGNRRKEKWEDVKNQNYFHGGNEGNWRGKLNRGLQGSTMISRAGYNPLTMGAKLGAAMSEQTMQQRAKMLEDPDYTWKGDDDLNRAAFETNNEGETRAYLRRNNAARYAGPHGAMNLERDVQHIEHMRRKYGNQAFRQAAFLQAVAGGTAFAGTDANGVNRSAEIWEAAGRVAGNDNGVLADLVAKGRGNAMNAGRVDEGGAGFGDTQGIAQRLRDDATYDVATASRELSQRVFESQGSGTLFHASMKPQAVRSVAVEINRRLRAAAAVGGAAYEQELANAANAYDALSASAPQLINVMDEQVMSVDVGTGQSVFNDIEDNRGAAGFLARRREYQRNLNVPAGAAAAGGPPPGGPLPGGPPTHPPARP